MENKGSDPCRLKTSRKEAVDDRIGDGAPAPLDKISPISTKYYP